MKRVNSAVTYGSMVIIVVLISLKKTFQSKILSSQTLSKKLAQAGTTILQFVQPA